MRKLRGGLKISKSASSIFVFVLEVSLLKYLSVQKEKALRKRREITRIKMALINFAPGMPKTDRFEFKKFSALSMEPSVFVLKIIKKSDEAK